MGQISVEEMIEKYQKLLRDYDEFRGSVGSFVFEVCWVLECELPEKERLIGNALNKFREDLEKKKLVVKG